MKHFQFLCIFLLSLSGFAQQNNFSAQRLKTESPYLKVLTKGAIIPLKSSSADVTIVGNIAHVKITQAYQNNGKTPIEAKYVFPMSTQAAVHLMEMTVGNRTTKAVVYEKKKAEKVYKKAIKEGKRASKLDQKRPNVFQMKVGNILPKDHVVITIYYTEMLSPINGDYQFVYPGVVGPRFTGESKKVDTSFVTAHTPKGTNATYEFDLNVQIKSGLIIQKVFSNTHKIDVDYSGTTKAEITLSKSDTNPSNRDFVLNYSFRGQKIESGLLLYEGEKENFFSLMIEPPKSISIEEIPAREYFFVLDVSGSMMGYPIDVAKSLLKQLVADLRTQDSFNILLFSADNQVFKPMPVCATEQNIKEAFDFLTGEFDNYYNGTYLLNALEKAYKMPRINKKSSRTLIVITDGYVTVEKEAFELINKNLNKANVFTFGIGSSVNRYLLEGMARVGQSESFIAKNKEEAYKVAKEFKQLIASPLLTQIQLEAQGFDIYDVEPSSIPDVFANRAIQVFGKYRGKAKGKITVSGYQGNNLFHQTISVKKAKKSKDHNALKYLWARKKIQQLDDYKKSFGNNIKEEVIQLGLQYNLATQYTSFVAVDIEKVNKKGKLNTVKQPLPLPQNVENSAVGAEASIRGYSKPKRTYKIYIDNIEKASARAIKIWMKGSFSNRIKQYLNNCAQIKIHFDARGKIVKIEKEINGLWITDKKMSFPFRELPLHLQVQKEFIITIHQ